MNNKKIHFLNAGSAIYTTIRPSDKVKNSSDIEKLNKKGDCYFAEVYLAENLNLNENRGLKQCKCKSPSLPGEEFPSINSAYTKLSEKYETTRLSHTTNVFTSFYVDEAMTKSLDDLRREKLKKSGPSLYDSLDKGEAEKFNKKAKSILDSKNDPITTIKEFDLVLESTKIMAYEEKVKELRYRLDGPESYPESNTPGSWQNWISDNIWIFGVARDRFLSQAEGFGT